VAATATVNLRSMFITFEGIDRSGKTTQARMLANALGPDTLLVREPGGAPVAERIRDLVKDLDVTLSPIAETLLFGAARAELVESVVRPALEEGKIVICDRYVDSTIAYQGGARGLGIERVEQLNDWIVGGLWPDLTFLLEVDPASAVDRGGEDDRFEREGEDFQQLVAAAYDELAGRHPDRYVPINGSAPVGEVHEQILEEVEERRAGAVS
jgi:dTMP kinase